MADILEPHQAQTSEDASTSTPPRPLCSVCNHKDAIYTCPGCTTRTCSLPCSSSHKSATGCSGQRNRVAYVPMNKYGWGIMMDDYVFLEDMGRKVGDWGKEIVKGGYGTNVNARGGSRGRGDGRGRGRGRGASTGGGPTRTKRDILKMQLEIRDIDMDLLPMGMERRKANQSSWDFKNQSALLTIEFKFNHSPDPLAPSYESNEPFFLLTHRNRMDVPLLSLVQTHINDRSNSKKENAVPAWVKLLVLPDPDVPDSFTPPQFVMPAQIDTLTTLNSKTKLKRAYYKLDPSQTLDVLLRRTHFVEFPTIELWEEFEGMLVDTEGTVTRSEGDERKSKRRKLNAKTGKAAINGLLGGYGSDGDSEGEVEAETGMDMLGGYVGSDEEGDEMNVEDTLVQLEEDDELDADGETDDEVEMNLDPAALLELIQQAGGKVISEDDPVGWGGSDGDEPGES